MDKGIEKLPKLIIEFHNYVSMCGDTMDCKDPEGVKLYRRIIQLARLVNQNPTQPEE